MNMPAQGTKGPSAARGVARSLVVVVGAAALSLAGHPGTEAGRVFAAAATAPPTSASQGRFTLNFQNAAIETVVQALARVVGLNYVLAPDVRGNVTVETREPLPADAALDVLRAILETQGFALRPAGLIYQIVRGEAARSGGTPVIIGSEAPARPDEEVVTQLVPLSGGSAGDMVASLRPLVSRGLAAAYEAANILIITDTVANLRRLLQIVRVAERESLPEELAVITLQTADASDAASVLERVLIQAAPGGRAPVLVADRRSNSLVVLGPSAELDRVRRLAADIDAGTTERSRLFTYRPEHGKAEDLGATLRASDPSFGDAVRIVADPPSNLLLVATAPDRWAELEAMLRQLDRARRQVWLSVTVAEVALQEETRLGIDWAALAGVAVVASLTGVVSSSSLSVPGLQELPAKPGLTAAVVDLDRFLAVLNAFAASHRVTVTATPAVVTTDGQKAVINVSESVPVVSAQRAATDQVTSAVGITSQQVEYRDVGVVLKATPRVSQTGGVALEIRQEASELGDIDPVTGAREFLKRALETAVVLRDGQALVLGGLVRQPRTVAETGIPFLKDTPLVGFLFRSRTTMRTPTELVFVIMPRVLPPTAP
ncbi:MAG TPA: secretin N-terminal domain-containing protein [Methylomirabilota bacterium]|nr:secretin N-terminal domain-containing protein [Methylomirabilota bacterium]